GAPVRTFVPPYNQPYDYPRGNSFSLSERRLAGRNRTDLGRLCRTLCETGYAFCRVSYRPMPQRLAEHLLRRRIDPPSKLEQIDGITCVRLNTPGGFDRPAMDMLERCVEKGGTAVVYGHPHSLTSEGPQNESWLVHFLKRVSDLKKQGRLEIKLPSNI